MIKKFLLILFGLLLLLPSITFAAVITVTSLDDELNDDHDCSFAEAIAATEKNGSVDNCVGVDFGDDTIIFAPEVIGTIPVTIAPTDGFEITQNLEIIGPGIGLIQFDGLDHSRRFIAM